MQQIEAARKATCEILGFKDWDDANDYRTTGNQDRERDRIYSIILATLAPDLRALEPVTFGYVNYRGESATRKAIPLGLRWGNTEWHSTDDWLLRAWDVEKEDEREFALADITVLDGHPFALSRTITKQEDATTAQPVTWEAFCDTSYFDMWCVRKVGEKTFGQGFHLVNKEGAEQLRDYLNGVEK